MNSIDLLIDNQDTIFVFRIDFVVVDNFDSPSGKFANNYGNVVVIGKNYTNLCNNWINLDSHYVLSSFRTSIENNFGGITGGDLIFNSIFDTSNFLDLLTETNIDEYAIQVDAVLKDRELYYINTPEDNEAMILDAQRNLDLKLEVEASAPVKDSLEGLYFMKLFLDSTFATIVFFMVLLSVMLIYSLMISDVDEKTYEMGMLRALGLRKVSLINLIIIQSLIFSLVGIFAGVIVSQLLNVCIRYFIFTYSVANITYLMTGSAAAIGISVGIIMPMASNIWAIKRALGKKIRDSLDVFHTGVNEVMIRIIKLSNFGLSPFEIVLGVTLVVMGMLTYYVAPAAFLFDRLDLFFFILNIILVGMIVGLSFL